MSDGTKISWTEATLNVVTGCTKVSEGCDHCYIERTMPFRVARRRFDKPGIGGTTGLVFHEDRLTLPLHWRKPRRVFVNSLADLWHDEVPVEFIARVFAMMATTPQHTYQLLTKRHARLRSVLSDPSFEDAVDTAMGEFTHSSLDQWPLPNAWIGVSVESQKWADTRIPSLLATTASVRWLSCEPLLSHLDLSRWIGEPDGRGTIPRGGLAPGGRVGRPLDRRDGPGLASRNDPQEPLEQCDALLSLAGAETRGEFDGAAELSTGARDVHGAALPRIGAPARVAALRWPDSSRADGEPQERRQDGQQADQPRTRHLLGAADSRAAGTSSRSPRPVGHAERDGEAQYGPGPRDLSAEGVGRGVAVDSGGLQRRDADDFEDRQGRPSISWIVLGGESGPGARPMDPAWASSLVEQCQHGGVPVFVKQLGSLAGRDHHDITTFPADLQVREYPQAVSTS